jgi:hypothetical protein
VQANAHAWLDGRGRLGDIAQLVGVLPQQKSSGQRRAQPIDVSTIPEKGAARRIIRQRKGSLAASPNRAAALLLPVCNSPLRRAPS